MGLRMIDTDPIRICLRCRQPLTRCLCDEPAPSDPPRRIASQFDRDPFGDEL